MKGAVKKIILEWQNLEVSNLKERKYKLLYTDEINAVYGIRRSGKSYFLFLEIEKLKKQGVPKENILYLSFDDERIRDIKSEDLSLIIDSYYELYPENLNKRIYLFFDEIQEIKGWESFIKRLYERKKYHVTITGSSSKLLGKEIATSLRGRTLKYHINPLSFKEFLEFKGIQINRNDAFSENRFEILKLQKEFLIFGGFPRVALEKDNNLKKILIKDYLDLIVYKDILERYSIRNPHLMRIIINYVLKNFASEFSISSFIKKFKNEYKLNKETVFNYFSYLEESDFLHFLMRFSHRIHQNYLSKKNYIGDNGFFSIVTFDDFDNFGRYFENLVFTELMKTNKEIFYYRGDNSEECDFVLIDENSKVLIQVAYSVEDAEVRKREIRGLTSAMKKFGVKKGYIITFGTYEELEVSDKNIIIIPFYIFFGTESFYSL